jgi:quinol-cytochrome oxidoreductase complex cytochrome b subunit
MEEKTPREEHEGGHPFWPTHVLDETMIFYVLLGLLLTLAILDPFGLHEKADPLNTPEGIKPEWYFLPLYQGLKYVPKVVGIVGVGIFAAMMLIWPLVDQWLYRRLGHRKVSTVVGAGVLVMFLTLLGLGYLSERTVTLGGAQYHFDLKSIPHRVTGEAATEESEG